LRCTRHWKAEQIEEVFAAIPWLKKLGMPGGEYRGPFDDKYLEQLRKFENLEELILADVSNLHVGFDPPWCGNVYDGPEGEAYLQRVNQERLEASTAVANLVLGVNKSSRKLWVGDRMFAESLKSNGTYIFYGVMSRGMLHLVGQYEGEISHFDN
jgi:hypothetical protein